MRDGLSAEIDGLAAAGVNADMVQGYWDGRDLDNPEPGANQSASYRHGFLNGRDDRRGQPRASAAALRDAGDRAIEEDAEKVVPGTGGGPVATGGSGGRCFTWRTPGLGVA